MVATGHRIPLPLCDKVNIDHGPGVWAGPSRPAALPVAPARPVASIATATIPVRCQTAAIMIPILNANSFRAGLRKEVALKEHAGPFAELDDRTGHTLRPESKMRRGIKRNGIEVSDMADLVCAFRSGFLAGHDITAQIDGNRGLPVHPAFLAQCLDWALTLDRGMVFVAATAAGRDHPRSNASACQRGY